MNNYRLLRGLLCATLLSGGVCVMGQSQTTISLEEIFELTKPKVCNSVCQNPQKPRLKKM